MRTPPLYMVCESGHVSTCTCTNSSLLHKISYFSGSGQTFRLSEEESKGEEEEEGEVTT